MSKLNFYGATECVTGSGYLLETGKATILLECGLVQGGCGNTGSRGRRSGARGWGAGQMN